MYSILKCRRVWSIFQAMNNIGSISKKHASLFLLYGWKFLQLILLRKKRHWILTRQFWQNNTNGTVKQSRSYWERKIPETFLLWWYSMQLLVFLPSRELIFILRLSRVKYSCLFKKRFIMPVEWQNPFIRVGQGWWFINVNKHLYVSPGSPFSLVS